MISSVTHLRIPVRTSSSVFLRSNAPAAAPWYSIAYSPETFIRNITLFVKTTDPFKKRSSRLKRIPAGSCIGFCIQGCIFPWKITPPSSFFEKRHISPEAVLRIQIRFGWIRKILASWIRIRIQGVKYQTKTAKKNFFTPKTQIWKFEKREIIKMSWFLNGSSSFMIKISEKKIENYFVKKISKS